MHTLSRRFLIVLGALALSAGLVACDNFEDNLEFVPGDSLTVVGPGSATTAQMRSYYVQAFTVNKSYTWSVSDGASGTVRRDGEYFDVTFPSPGTYTVTVNNGQFSGTRTVTVAAPAP